MIINLIGIIVFIMMNINFYINIKNNKLTGNRFYYAFSIVSYIVWLIALIFLFFVKFSHWYNELHEKRKNGPQIQEKK